MFFFSSILADMAFQECLPTVLSRCFCYKTPHGLTSVNYSGRLLVFSNYDTYISDPVSIFLCITQDKIDWV